MRSSLKVRSCSRGRRRWLFFGTSLGDFKGKLEEMNDILAGKMEAHRNHKRAGKCNSCSRRKNCPERLDYN